VWSNFSVRFFTYLPWKECFKAGQTVLLNGGDLNASKDWENFSFSQQTSQVKLNCWFSNRLFVVCVWGEEKAAECQHQQHIFITDQLEELLQVQELCQTKQVIFLNWQHQKSLSTKAVQILWSKFQNLCLDKANLDQGLFHIPIVFLKGQDLWKDTFQQVQWTECNILPIFPEGPGNFFVVTFCDQFKLLLSLRYFNDNVRFSLHFRLSHFKTSCH